MKIAIIFTPETLLIVSATLQPVYNTRAHTRREKSTLSIAFDVSKKLESKACNLKGQQTIFNSKKKVTVPLKHHEADMLELLLIDQIKTVNDEFIKTKLQGVINQINQKLA
ncbi:hypothetical protein [Flavobacterium covae]|uniref:hypothetical protein n=1 Tax=Flavobacterium covae TaxID=2906076 RepID=UPI000745B0EF|nr:hypothetical protein [Flavobacterium covae]AMA48967.1 hypothetical protein AWN65_05565 [Flavobacterium covae]MCJ1809885.1 hypothetical protein [Flavobacterium covae]